LVKSKIIKQLKDKHPNLQISQIKDIFNTMLDTIIEGFNNDRPLELRNFGRFSIKTTKSKYNARNPKTGEIIFLPKRKKISFKMSKHLKEEINK
jgi:integration host factor subunit beta